MMTSYHSLSVGDRVKWHEPEYQRTIGVVAKVTAGRVYVRWAPEDRKPWAYSYNEVVPA